MAPRPDTASSSTSLPSVDVAIVGGGLAGMTLAALLGGAGLRVALVEQVPLAAMLEPRRDGRTTALSWSSRQVLNAAGLWDALEPHGAPIAAIRVADKDSRTALQYAAAEVQAPAFGYVVDNYILRRIQAERLQALGDAVQVIAPARVAGMEAGAQAATLQLEDGRSLQARLVVGADGRNSLLRRLAGIDSIGWPYGQTALSFNIAHEHPHNGIAVEHFMPSGPFAALPLTDLEDGTHRSAIVWSERPRRAAALLKLPAEDFQRVLQRAVGSHLGRVSVLTPPSAWPLSFAHAYRYTAPRLALVSEAAHALHPIAGQGLNVGMRDLAVLSELIVDNARLGLDIGDATLLARYERFRRGDVTLLAMVTDGLTRLFSTEFAPVRLSRRLGLAAVGQLPRLRRMLIHSAMGTSGNVSRTIRGEAL